MKALVRKRLTDGSPIGMIIGQMYGFRRLELMVSALDADVNVPRDGSGYYADHWGHKKWIHV